MSYHHAGEQKKTQNLQNTYCTQREVWGNFVHTNNTWHISLERAWIGRDEAKTTSGVMESVRLSVTSVQTLGTPVVLPEDFLGAPHELTSTRP